MKKWTDSEVEFIETNLGSLSYKEMGVELNRSTESVKKKSCKLGFGKNHPHLMSDLKRNHSCNENYFAVPNTENSYWAGFIAADGTVSKKENSVRICLSSVDTNHLHKFKDCIETTSDVLTYDRPEENKSSFVGSNPTYSLVYASHPLIKRDLKSVWNITPNKTLTINPPKIEDTALKLSFIKGLWDGDGTKCINKSLYLGMIFLGTKQMMEWVYDVVEDVFPSKNKKKLYQIDKIWKLCIFGEQAAYLAYKMEKEVPIQLDRKWSDFEPVYDKYGLSC